MRNSPRGQGLLLAGVGALAIVAAAYAYWMRPGRPASRAAGPTQVVRTAPPSPIRSWRWPGLSEWVVQDVVRHLAAWSLVANGEKAGSVRVKVSRDEGTELPGTFRIDFAGPQGERRITVKPNTHVWDPAAYVDAAREVLGPGVSPSPTPEGAADPAVGELLLKSDTASLRQADAMLFRALSTRPRDPALHAQAALLWAAHALRETDGTEQDARAFVNGVTAHLALARALRGPGPSTPEGETAAAVLDALLFRQVEAMQAVDQTAGDGGRADIAAWKNAIRLRVTHDPRLIPPSGPRSRLEQLEGLRALLSGRGCRQAVSRARAWSMPPAADWVRSSIRNCNDPEWSQLSSIHFELQAQDAAALIDLQAGSPEAILDALRAGSAKGTADVTPAASVVSDYVRADAGQRRLVGAFQVALWGVTRLGLPDQAKMMDVSTRPIREKLTQRALLDVSFEQASQTKGDTPPSPQACERLAALVIDRPDLVKGHWETVGRCRAQEALRLPGKDPYSMSGVLPGTGLPGTGPWEPALNMTQGLADAVRRTPWSDVWLMPDLQRTYRGDPPGPVLLQAYARLLEYDPAAMGAVISRLHGSEHDDDVQRLAERICSGDVETCAGYAEYLSTLGRDQAAEPMWKRALAEAQDQIGLSKELGGYVNLLLERGQTAEALNVARRAANVYSAGGLRTLAVALERLGRLEDAAREYAKITERYGDKQPENTFFVRYGQRYHDGRFADQVKLATAALFPKGLVKRTLADFQQHGRAGAVARREFDERLWRIGVRPLDLVAAVDGFVVENDQQMDAVLTFTDDPAVTVIVMRQRRAAGSEWLELSGPYRRRKYGPIKGD